MSNKRSGTLRVTLRIARSAGVDAVSAVYNSRDCPPYLSRTLQAQLPRQILAASELNRWEVYFEAVNCIFFYGLFMDTNLLRDMGLHPNVIGPAELPDFRIRIGDRATLLPNRGSKTYGIVMKLSSKDVAVLYSKPGVSDYRPETVNAILIDDRSVQRALCYNLPPDMLGPETNAEYAEKLSALILELGFPSEYANEIAC